MTARNSFIFLVALFGTSSVYDFIGYYAAALPSQTAYFLGTTLGGVIVWVVWLISMKGQQHDK